MNVCSESEKKIFLFFIFLSETIIKKPGQIWQFCKYTYVIHCDKKYVFVKRLSNLSVLRSLLHAF